MTFHIKTLLSPLLQPKQQGWKIDLLNKWPEIMGTLAQHVSIEKIEQEYIVLGVQHASWLQELYLMGTTILETINQNLDQPRFKTIRFKQRGSTPDRTKNKSVSNAPSKQENSPIAISTQEQQALNLIDDPELRQALHSFLVRCYREKRK